MKTSLSQRLHEGKEITTARRRDTQPYRTKLLPPPPLTVITWPKGYPPNENLEDTTQYRETAEGVITPNDMIGQREEDLRTRWARLICRVVKKCIQL